MIVTDFKTNPDNKKYETSLENNDTHIKRITLKIGDNEYCISETIDHRLNINKIYGSGNDKTISVFPRVSNEVDIL